MLATTIDGVGPPSNLILVGHSGAGKTTLAQHLARRTQFVVVELGHIVRAEAAAQGAALPLLYADRVFREGGGAHFAERLAPGLAFRGPVIFVGPRRQEEVDLMQHRFGPAVVVALNAPERVRGERRSEQADEVGDDRWLERRDETEAGWGLARIVGQADVLLDGTCPTQEMADVLLREWALAGASAGHSVPADYSGTLTGI